MKANDWLIEHGLEGIKSFNESKIRVVHRDSKLPVFDLLGSELSVAMSNEKLIELLEEKLKSI